MEKGSRDLGENHSHHREQTGRRIPRSQSNATARQGPDSTRRKITRIDIYRNLAHRGKGEGSERHSADRNLLQSIRLHPSKKAQGRRFHFKQARLHKKK